MIISTGANYNNNHGRYTEQETDIEPADTLSAGAIAHLAYTSAQATGGLQPKFEGAIGRV